MRILTPAVRGKCRFCDCSVSAERWGWFAEGWPSPDGYECASAPRVPCPDCWGVGTVPDPSPGAAPTARIPCVNCLGTGEVPGPHWPWRHPPTAV
jgi:hypothetical protein